MNRLALHRAHAFGENLFIRRFRRNSGINRLEQLHPRDTPFNAARQVLTDVVELFELGNRRARFCNEVFRFGRNAFCRRLRGLKLFVAMNDVIRLRRQEILRGEPKTNEGRRRKRPRLLAFDQAKRNNIARHQVDVQRGFVKHLKRKPVRDGKGRNVVAEDVVGERLRPSHLRILSRDDEFEIQALRKILTQARQLHRVAERVDAPNLRPLVEVAEEVERTVDFGQHIVEDCLHRDQNRFRILRRLRVALDVFGV